MKAIKLPEFYKITETSGIKFGDLNLDGFPDMIGIFSVKTLKSASILMNKGDFLFALSGIDVG